MLLLLHYSRCIYFLVNILLHTSDMSRESSVAGRVRIDGYDSH
jgi:hypothetical protein